MKPVRTPVLCWALLVLLLSACAPRPHVFGQVLTVALDQDPRDLNPLLAADGPSATVAGRLFSGLVRVDEQGSPQPDLAESWVVGEGGRSFTFWLRPGLRWQDGAPLTADDVVFTVRALTDPHFPGPQADLWRGRNAVALDDRRVRIVIPEPRPGFLTGDATLSPVPRHILQDVPVSDWARHHFNRAPVGSGPFRLVRWQPGQVIELAANSYYHAGRPRLDGLTYRIITSQAGAAAALMAGDVLWAEVSQEALPALTQRSDITLVQSPSRLYYAVGFNMGARRGKPSPYFRDRRVRRAWAMAIDRREVVAAAAGNLGVPVTGPFSPEGGVPVPDIPYNPAGARRLLEEAGWHMGGDGVRRRDGVPLRIELPVRAGKADRIRAALVMAAYLQRVGIEVEVRPEEFKSRLLGRLQPPDFDFDAVLMGWTVGSVPDLYELLHSSQIPRRQNGQPVGGANFISYRNPEMDVLLSAIRTESMPAGRRRLEQRVAGLLADDLPYYFLWSDVSVVAVSRRLHGPRPGANDPWADVHRWYLAP